MQRHAAGGAFAVDGGALGIASGGGKPLPDAVRGKMEAALGADFSNVRVHVGPQAERIGAIAFTTGSDIYFAPGRYQPETIQGQQLLGHELAHVEQQRQGRVRNPLGSGLAVVQDRALEAEADRLGQRAATHRMAVQAKIAPGMAQPSAPVRISPPVSTGPGSYRLTAGNGGRQVGSVMVHARDKGAVEVTDLGVDQGQRGHGIGQMLLASAAKTGLQFGKSKVTLAAQDKGSGHLTQWYKDMGFTQTGVNQRGFPQLEAPISRVLAGAAQRKMQSQGIGNRAFVWTAPNRVLSKPEMATGAAQRMPLRAPPTNSPRIRRFAQILQRMDTEEEVVRTYCQSCSMLMPENEWGFYQTGCPNCGGYEFASAPPSLGSSSTTSTSSSTTSLGSSSTTSTSLGGNKLKNKSSTQSTSTTSSYNPDEDPEQKEIAKIYKNHISWKNYGSCCMFRQYVPAGSATIQAALKSQKLTDAVYHTDKAFWVVIKTSTYDLKDKRGMTMMLYTFTSNAAKSLFEDKLVCQSAGAKIGETAFPGKTLWKTQEEGARGIGSVRLQELSTSCTKIQAFDEKNKEIKPM